MYNLFLVSVILILCVSSTAVWPQQETSFLNKALLRQEMDKRQTQQTITTAHPLEEVINPDIYRVGPGDVFEINIWGVADREFQERITPEGTLLIPTVGSIYVADLTLTKARENIFKAVKNKYTNGQPSITLVALREFKVSVSGAVNIPGTVVVTAMDRVADAITQAEGFLSQSDMGEREVTVPIEANEEINIKSSQAKQTEREKQKVASMRNIQLRRRSGEKLIIDLRMLHLF